MSCTYVCSSGHLAWSVLSCPEPRLLGLGLSFCRGVKGKEIELGTSRWADMVSWSGLVWSGWYYHYHYE